MNMSIIVLLKRKEMYIRKHLLYLLLLKLIVKIIKDIITVKSESRS